MGSTPTELDRLSDQWLETMLDLNPELHVELGRPGREGEYTDLSPEGHAAAADATRAMLHRVESTQPLDADDAVTRAELVRVLGLAVEQHDAGFWRNDLNVIASPVQGLRDVFDLMPTDSEQDWHAVAMRLGNLPAALSGYVASLRAGITAADTPATRQVQAVAQQARRQADDGSFFTALVGRADVPASLRSDLERGAAGAREAYAELADFLLHELDPAARDDDAVGRERYALASRGFVGATIDLDETYEWGVDLLGRIVAEQEAVAERIAPGGGVAGAVAALEADESRVLHGTQALQAWMQETSDRAVAELAGTQFDIPDALRRLECRIAPTQEGGIYYTAPSEDFSRPGRMWWSVPEGVTRFDAWRELTTVYHEGVPGHHLQLGTAIHPDAGLNAWRRLNWNSGHGEGWALYAERLMERLGYLDDPADRLGMLYGQRMRAARVVVDIGVHLGKPTPDGSGTWRGDDAVAFLTDHLGMNAPFVRFEALRYLGWAGQAPSYSVGQRLWEQLRDDWTDRHGPDMREFHRRALAPGSIGLETLRDTLLADPAGHQESSH